MGHKRTIGAGRIKARIYPLMESTIENSVRYGVNRVNKHLDKDVWPEDEAAINTMVECIMNGICETFSFENDYE
jgi:hypothetical protein